MSRRAAPTHIFVSSQTFKKKLHAVNAWRFVEAVGAQVMQYDDGLYRVVIAVHRPDPVAKWLSRQTPDTDWILEDLREHGDDDYEYLNDE